MSHLWFIDFEASSLGNDSYPIEVGIACLDLDNDVIVSDGFLIAPLKHWTDWSFESEKIHGMPRGVLHNGKPVSEACGVLNDRLAGEVVYCDSPRFDGFWNKVMFDAVGIKPQFEFDHIWTPLMDIPHDDPDASFNRMMHWRAEVNRYLQEPNPHRAEADARLLANVYLRAKALWKASQ